MSCLIVPLHFKYIVVFTFNYVIEFLKFLLTNKASVSDVSMTYFISEAVGQARAPGGRYQCFTCGVGK